MAFYRVHTDSMRSHDAFTACFHGAHIACAALSRRSHCAFNADGVLKAQ